MERLLFQSQRNRRRHVAIHLTVQSAKEPIKEWFLETTKNFLEKDKNFNWTWRKFKNAVIRESNKIQPYAFIFNKQKPLESNK